MKVFAGNSNRALAEAICRYLNLPLGKASVRRFADQEIFVEIQENVRGEDVFVVQPTSYPANDHLMELLIMIDAFRRASARRITAVLPYFGYARQDRKAGPRTPISAKLVANLITEAGADRDPHPRPARRPDPGLLRHPDRQSLCRADPRPRRQGALRHLQRHGRLAGRRRRGARPLARQAPRRACWPSSTSAATGRANRKS